MEHYDSEFEDNLRPTEDLKILKDCYAKLTQSCSQRGRSGSEDTCITCVVEQEVREEFSKGHVRAVLERQIRLLEKLIAERKNNK